MVTMGEMRWDEDVALAVNVRATPHGCRVCNSFFPPGFAGCRASTSLADQGRPARVRRPSVLSSELSDLS